MARSFGAKIAMNSIVELVEEFGVPNDADKAPGVVELLRVAVLLVEIDRVLPRQAGAPAPASPVCLPGEFGDGRRRRALDLPLERRLGQTRSATFC